MNIHENPFILWFSSGVPFLYNSSQWPEVSNGTSIVMMVSWYSTFSFYNGTPLFICSWYAIFHSVFWGYWESYVFLVVKILWGMYNLWPSFIKNMLVSNIFASPILFLVFFPIFLTFSFLWLIFYNRSMGCIPFPSWLFFLQEQ